jgi:hypothetical protein
MLGVGDETKGETDGCTEARDIFPKRNTATDKEMNLFIV